MTIGLWQVVGITGRMQYNENMVDTPLVLPIYKCFHCITSVLLFPLLGQMFSNNDTQRFSIKGINHTSYFKTTYHLDLQYKRFRVKVHGYQIFINLFSHVYKIIAISKYFQNKVFNHDSSSRVIYCNIYKSHELDILTKPMYSPACFC